MSAADPLQPQGAPSLSSPCLKLSLTHLSCCHRAGKGHGCPYQGGAAEGLHCGSFFPKCSPPLCHFPCRWVQVACPRLSIDWGEAFSKPLLTPYEVSTLCFGGPVRLGDVPAVSPPLPIGILSPGMLLGYPISCEASGIPSASSFAKLDAGTSPSTTSSPSAGTARALIPCPLRRLRWLCRTSSGSSLTPWTSTPASPWGRGQ